MKKLIAVLMLAISGLILSACVKNMANEATDNQFAQDVSSAQTCDLSGYNRDFQKNHDTKTVAYQETTPIDQYQSTNW